MAAIKAAVRFGKTKLSTMASFPDLQKAGLAKSRIQYHLDASLSAAERLKLSFNAHTRAAKVKLSRRLDDKNRFDAEYNYIDNTSRFLCVTLKHQYNNTHSFAITGNYGAKKFTLEWDCKTENGPWTLATTFPFTDR